MAKPKNTRESRRSSKDDKDDGDEEPKKGRGRSSSLLTLLVVLAAGGAYVTWHRRNDPARKWARTVERAREQKISSRLRRCFGGDDASAVRAIIPEVRRGNVPPPFRSCNLTEVMVSPGAFDEDLMHPPSAAASAQFRERAKLEELRGSLTQLQRALSGIDRNQPVPDAARDRIATALEDVAVDVDGERSRFNDLVNAADDSATWY